MLKKINIKSKVTFFSVLLMFFIVSCSKDDANYDDPISTGPSEIVLLWQSGTVYETNIKVGQTITWRWGGGTHNLRSTGGVESFECDYNSNVGFTFSHTFTKIGSTSYQCDPHADNQYGTVIVTE